MKRITVLTLIFVITFIFVAGIAEAGVVDFVKDKISGGILLALSAVIFGIAGLFLKGIYDVGKAKKAFEEMVQVVKEIEKAKGEKSPGGKKITNEEWGNIGKEGYEAIVAILYAIPVSWQKKIGLIK